MSFYISVKGKGSTTRFFIYPSDINEVDFPALKTRGPYRGEPTDKWEKVYPEDYEVYFNGPYSDFPHYPTVYYEVYKLKDHSYNDANMIHLLNEIKEQKINPEKIKLFAEYSEVFAQMDDAFVYTYNKKNEAAKQCKNNEECTMMGGSRKKRGKKTRQNKKRHGRKSQRRT